MLEVSVWCMCLILVVLIGEELLVCEVFCSVWVELVRLILLVVFVLVFVLVLVVLVGVCDEVLFLLLFVCGSLGRLLLEMVVFMGLFFGWFRFCVFVIGGIGRNFRVDWFVFLICLG